MKKLYIFFVFVFFSISVGSSSSPAEPTPPSEKIIQSSYDSDSSENLDNSVTEMLKTVFIINMVLHSFLMLVLTAKNVFLPMQKSFYMFQIPLWGTLMTLQLIFIIWF